MNERDYLWDNIKALLIFFVVAGHFLELSALNTKLSVFTDTFIYSFHMPAFLFVSGYFLKRYCTNGKVRVEKASVIFAYYIIFQLIFYVLKLIAGLNLSKLNLFNPARGLWYLLALFFYYLIIPLLEKLPPWFVLPMSIVMALFVANNKSAATYFTILRAFIFAPYCFAGYYLSGDAVKKLRLMNVYVRYPAAIGCVLASISLWLFNLDHPWMKFFYGKINNLKIGLNMGEASLLRLQVYVIAFLMIAALLLAMPSKKTVFSAVGKNSLQIFVIHMAFVIILFDSEIVNININNNLILFVGLLGSFAVTVLLSLWFFGYPFRWIQTRVRKLYSIKSKD